METSRIFISRIANEVRKITYGSYGTTPRNAEAGSRNRALKKGQSTLKETGAGTKLRNDGDNRTKTQEEQMTGATIDSRLSQHKYRGQPRPVS